MLSTLSSTNYSQCQFIAPSVNKHNVPVLDAGHSETDCQTETENETPPDSPVKPVSGSASRHKQAVDIVQATDVLSLITEPEPRFRRSTPEICEDPGYVAEGETNKVFASRMRFSKKSFPSPEGPIWRRRRVGSPSTRSPSPRTAQNTPMDSRSNSPASRPDSNLGAPTAHATRRLPLSPLVAPADLVLPASEGSTPTMAPSNGVLCTPSSSMTPLVLDDDRNELRLDIPLPPRPIISPETTPPDDLDVLSPLELPAPKFISIPDMKDHVIASPTSPNESLPSRLPALHPSAVPAITPVPLPKPAQPMPRHAQEFHQYITNGFFVPPIRTPPSLLSVGTPPTPRPSPSPLTAHPRRPSMVVLPSLFAASPLGLGLRRVPLDSISLPESESAARDANGVIPPAWVIPRPLSSATATATGIKELESTSANSPSVLQSVHDSGFNPYFSASLNSSIYFQLTK